MKAIYRLPTKEPYGYLEIEEEVLTAEQAVLGHRRALEAFNTPNLGLDSKEWNKALDGYLTLNTLPSDVYERMSDRQKLVIQEIKKSIKRLAPEKELRERI
jgi:hypothetical protein